MRCRGWRKIRCQSKNRAVNCKSYYCQTPSLSTTSRSLTPNTWSCLTDMHTRCPVLHNQQTQVRRSMHHVLCISPWKARTSGVSRTFEQQRLHYPFCLHHIWPASSAPFNIAIWHQQTATFTAKWQLQLSFCGLVNFRVRHVYTYQYAQFPPY